MDDLTRGKGEYDVIFHIDFHQLKLEHCTFHQEMICTVYYRPPGLRPGEIGREHFYRHYVGESSSMSNNVGFMQEAVKRAIEGMSWSDWSLFSLTASTEFAIGRRFKIWSDEGLKHFKNSSAMFAMAQIQELSKVRMVLNGAEYSLDFDRLSSRLSGSSSSPSMETIPVMQEPHMASNTLTMSQRRAGLLQSVLLRSFLSLGRLTSTLQS